MGRGCRVRGDQRRQVGLVGGETYGNEREEMVPLLTSRSGKMDRRRVEARPNRGKRINDKRQEDEKKL